jgi:curli biogenesis system outer membrane secretion channel CsgG
MKKSLVLIVGVAVLTLCCLPACSQKETPTTPPAQAAPAAGEAAKEAAQPAKAADAELKMAANTVCPISGSEVGSMVKDAHVDFGGYRVGLCCNDCAAKFMEKPDENLKKALGQDK